MIKVEMWDIRALCGMLVVVGMLIVLRWRLTRRTVVTEGRGIEIGNEQTIGRRSEQDDYFTSATTRLGTLAVICDGISGLSNGRMSSTLAVTEFAQQFQQLDDRRAIADYFERAAKLSNRKILDHLGGMNGGTTVVAAVVSDGYLHWGAVGDSQITVFREGEFIPVNSKHTLESVLHEKVLTGEMTKEDAEQSPMRRHLINYLGYEGFEKMEIGEPIALRKKDKVLLCSDGVHDALTEVDLEAILREDGTAQEYAEEIIAAVIGKGYKNQDNATVIVLEKGW